MTAVENEKSTVTVTLNGVEIEATPAKTQVRRFSIPPGDRSSIDSDTSTYRRSHVALEADSPHGRSAVFRASGCVARADRKAKA